MQVRRPAARSRSRPVLAVSVLIALSGCGSSPAPPPPDLDAAKQTLERALTAWRKGETIEGVVKATPSIRVSDPSWEGGDKLTKFELKGKGQPRGGQQAFQVTLWLTGAKGKRTQEIVEYRVTTEPVATVTRSIFD